LHKCTKYVSAMKFIFTLIALTSFLSCQAQNNKTMETKNNPLLCDPQTGVCEIPDSVVSSQKETIKSTDKPVKIIYFTDPICSSCWGIEPQLRRLKLEYGNDVEIEYRMGGLLPDWSYNSGGISKPSDVAHHWDEVSAYYKMPIDGDVWLEDPLSSSYPPSIAFKAAQYQDKEKAVLFMRELRELLFLRKKNITKWEFIEQAAKKSGLDTRQLKTDYEGRAKEWFQNDLELAKKMGVRGFPSVFITNEQGQSEFIYGFRPYAVYEYGIQKIYPEITKYSYPKDWQSLFKKYASLTTREYSELSDKSWEESEKELEQLADQGKLKKVISKNGPLWVKD